MVASSVEPAERHETRTVRNSSIWIPIGSEKYSSIPSAITTIMEIWVPLAIFSISRSHDVGLRCK